jgi:hypothetical protein
MTKSTILLCVSLFILSCNSKEKDNLQHTYIDPRSYDWVKELEEKARLLKKDTNTQLQMALMEWAFNKPKELERLFDHKTDIADYLMNETELPVYAEQRGLGKTYLERRLTSSKLNFKALEKIRYKEQVPRL